MAPKLISFLNDSHDASLHDIAEFVNLACAEPNRHVRVISTMYGGALVLWEGRGDVSDDELSVLVDP